MFSGCKELTELPDISIWKTNNMKDISYLFYRCENLKDLPDISKWSFSSPIIDMSCLFKECFSLNYYSEFSKYNIIIRKSNKNSNAFPFESLKNLFN